MTGTPLADKLRRVIEANGPISVAEYMALCLGDPEHGYYATRDPFGAAGDFVTAPDVSQMFGEIVGAWLIEAWRLAGAPNPAALVELGPGRGTLMADILRVSERLPEFRQAVEVNLVETSPVLRQRQRETLQASGMDIAWRDTLLDCPARPVFVVANEFFDALPVRQFVRRNGEWRERVVGLGEDARLAFGVGAARLDDGPAAREGAILELRPAGVALMAEIARRIVADGGAALVIDYGHAETALGDTLQAVRRHAYADPLEAPGEADLTAHVDFAALARAARAEGAATHGPMPQGAFLTALGMSARAERLAAAADDDTRVSIAAALRRLTAADEMGTLFKVLAVTPQGVVPPPFAPVGSDSS